MIEKQKNVGNFVERKFILIKENSDGTFGLQRYFQKIY